jgi:hypothetical protein
MLNNTSLTPLLSVIIPTRNRMCYIIHSIRSILSIRDPELELIISDNSESDELSGWLTAQVTDSRLKYRYIPEQISMTDNYNIAIGMAGGLYICALGDDDSVSPCILDVVRWANTNGIDALSSKSNSASVYFWPDFISRTKGGGLASKLIIEDFTGAAKRINVERELIHCIANAGQGTFGLPRLYHGIIRRECLVNAFTATAFSLRGVSPDVYGAIVVSRNINNSFTIDYPLTIGGCSGGSNTGRAAQGKHKGPLKDDPHMKPYKNLDWPTGVPEFFSVETVWASASIEAINSLGRKDLIESYNYALLHALCAIRHPDYLSLIVKSYESILEAQRRSRLLGYMDILKESICIGFRFWVRVARRIIIRLNPGRAVYPKLSNIHEAAQCLSQHLENTRGKLALGNCARKLDG